MQTDAAVERSKIIRWSESPWNQSGRKEKGLWRKGFDSSYGVMMTSWLFVRKTASVSL